MGDTAPNDAGEGTPESAAQGSNRTAIAMILGMLHEAHGLLPVAMRHEPGEAPMPELAKAVETIRQNLDEILALFRRGNAGGKGGKHLVVLGWPYVDPASLVTITDLARQFRLHAARMIPPGFLSDVEVILWALAADMRSDEKRWLKGIAGKARHYLREHGQWPPSPSDEAEGLASCIAHDVGLQRTPREIAEQVLQWVRVSPHLALTTQVKAPDGSDGTRRVPQACNLWSDDWHAAAVGRVEDAIRRGLESGVLDAERLAVRAMKALGTPHGKAKNLFAFRDQRQRRGRA